MSAASLRQETGPAPAGKPPSRRTSWSLVAVAAALLALLTAALAAGLGALRAIDRSVALRGYALTYGHGPLVAWWVAVARYGQPMVLRAAMVLLAAFQLRRGRRRLAVWLVAAAVVENVVAPLAKYLLHRPRPHWLHPIAVEHSLSFPSGHATAAGMFVTAAALLALSTLPPGLRRTAVVAGACLLCVVISLDRIMLGVHYLSDVVGGLLLGAVLTLACWLVAVHRTGPSRVHHGAMRIGVSAGGGVRAHVLADVLRRSAELRGTTVWVVAPPGPDLSGLNVAPPGTDDGPVDVVVEVAEARGEVPTDDLGARLVLLSTPPNEPVALTPSALDDARRRLASWRSLVARWAEEPSAPLLDSYAVRALTALRESWDTSAVVSLLDELADDTESRPGSRFETAAYLDRILALDLVSEVGRAPGRV